MRSWASIYPNMLHNRPVIVLPTKVQFCNNSGGGGLLPSRWCIIGPWWGSELLWPKCQRKLSRSQPYHLPPYQFATTVCRGNHPRRFTSSVSNYQFVMGPKAAVPFYTYPGVHDLNTFRLFCFLSRCSITQGYNMPGN